MQARDKKAALRSRIRKLLKDMPETSVKPNPGQRAKGLRVCLNFLIHH